jgi:hypothetical protein
VKPALLWITVEFAGRVGGIALIVGLFRLWCEGGAARISLGVASSCLLLATHVILWVLFDRRRRRIGQSLSDLGYRFTWSAGVLGAVCGLALLGTVRLTAAIDARLFGPAIEPEAMRMFAEAGVWAVLPFLLGNAILAPVVEEFAWRGHIHAVVARDRGETIALVTTALLFAVKHLLVDLSLARVVSLVVGSFLLGLVRLRMGTFAATVAHFGLNIVASTVLVVTALTR